MGRLQTWNEDHLLGAVMAVFREKGFSQTTVRDIGHATGVHPGSIYKVYGDKEGLFTAALRAYCERVVKARVQAHLVDNPDPLVGVRSFFTSTFEKSPRPEQGCLITNSAVDGLSVGPEARAEVSAGLGSIERGFESALRRMKARGMIDSSQSIPRLAALLLALYQGVLLLLRARTTTAKLDGIIEDGLQSIFPKQTTPHRKKTGS
jgi:AcrR family transcriptional regulator